MSRFELTTDDDTSTHRENLTAASTTTPTCSVRDRVPAGQHVVIEVGTRSFDLSGTNDVEIHSASHFGWFINSVEVRISP